MRGALSSLLHMIFDVSIVTVLASFAFSFLLTERSRKEKGRKFGLQNVRSLTVTQVHCHFGVLLYYHIGVAGNEGSNVLLNVYTLL